jgi:hypothetical protein
MSTEDRRAPGAPRIPFDSLVEVGGALGPSFEAQAVNVSEEGMQLRTAYLPELGQQVTCRFETAPGQSVVTSGEVVWSSSADQGGEFGIRFTDIDPDSVDALKRACGFGGSAAPGQPGAKVRLYIDGLASPMRAKIRDAQSTAITVGSDLGFLQVGKQLELEDAQSGTKRPASIDRVDVAVDPNSHIPQLVVTLRYRDVAADAATDGASTRPAAPKNPYCSDDLAALDDASTRMKGAFARQAARIAPAFQRFAHRAKVTIALLARRRLVDDDAMPRRTTSPPPGGGLHATGRRVVRGEAGASAADDPAAAPKAKTARRNAAVATAVMVAAILGAVAIKKSQHDAPPSSSVTATVAGDTPAAAGTTASVAPTIAPAATQPPAAESPISDKPAGGSTVTPAEGAEASHATTHKRHARLAPFGNGPVHHGNVLHLKMDGPVESIEGAQQPTGFTVKAPGRKSLEAAAPLAARDSRIAAIKVSNEASGAELNVTFKDGVPNYQVSAKGDTLIIALAPAGPLETTVAKRDEKGTKGAKHGTHGRDTMDTRPER